jgi:DNA-binding protein HU-beta
VNKTQLRDAIATQTGQSKAAVDGFIDAMKAIVQAELASGGNVALAGFGTFKTAGRKPQSRYSALAGRVVDTPAKTVPKFVPGEGLKAAVNGQALVNA